MQEKTKAILGFWNRHKMEVLRETSGALLHPSHLPSNHVSSPRAMSMEPRGSHKEDKRKLVNKTAITTQKASC